MCLVRRGRFWMRADPGRQTARLIAALVAFPAALSAQVSIHPLTTAPAAWERFAVRLANQSDTAVTGLTVSIPEVVTVIGVEQGEGWEVAQQRGGETIPHRIQWTGGSVSQGEYREFAFLGRVSGNARRATLVFPVILERADGSRIEWTSQPGLARPAPTVRIVGPARLSGLGALAIAGGAFAVSVFALILALTRRRSA